MASFLQHSPAVSVLASPVSMLHSPAVFYFGRLRYLLTTSEDGNARQERRYIGPMGRHWGGISWYLVPRLPSLVLRPPLLIPAPRSLVAPKWVDRSGCALAWGHTAHQGRLRLLLATASSLSAFGAFAGADAALRHLVAKLSKDHPHLLENPPPGPTEEQAQRAAALLLIGGDEAKALLDDCIAFNQFLRQEYGSWIVVNGQRLPLSDSATFGYVKNGRNPCDWFTPPQVRARRALPTGG